MLMILCGILGFAVGFGTAALCYGIQLREERRLWEQEREAWKNGPDRHAAEAVCPGEVHQEQGLPDSAGADTRKMAADPAPASLDAPRRQKPEVPHASPVQKQETEKAKRRERESYYPAFAPVETLELHFQPSFPEMTLFRPGTGYVRDAQNRVLPEESMLYRTNSAMGYAREGLFYLFDVIYQGKEYTFRQIMDGEMGDAYVQIRRFYSGAIIEETGHFGSYTLVRKGKLEVTDIR